MRVDSEVADIFPRIKVGPQHRKDLADGWTEVFIPMSELNPTYAGFDKVVFRAYFDVPKAWVEMDGIGLTAADDKELAKAAAVAHAARQRARQGGGLHRGLRRHARGEPAHLRHRLQRDARPSLGAPVEAGRHRAALGRQPHQPLQLARWATRGTPPADWYFRNVNYTDRDDFSWKDFFADNVAHGVKTALTVPTLGWVAKDTSSASFTADVYGPQESMDPDHPKAGNGKARNGKPLDPPSPTTTSVEAPPKFVADWTGGHREGGPHRGPGHPR